MLRSGLQAVNSQGKLFVPTYCGTGQTRDWNKIYVSFSGNVSARTVLGKTSSYLSYLLTFGAIAGQVALTVSSPHVVAVVTPLVTGTVLANKTTKVPKVAMIVASSVKKWFGRTKLTPYSLKWDPSQPLLTHEGDIRCFLSNWSDINELPRAWLGANTGLAFFSLIAPFATVSSLLDSEPEDLARLDSLMYPPQARATIIKRNTEIHMYSQKVLALAEQLKVQQRIDTAVHSSVDILGLVQSAYGAYSNASTLSKAYDAISTATKGDSLLWDKKRNSLQAIKYWCSAASDVHDPESILRLLHGAMERFPEDHVTSLLEPALRCHDVGSALEVLGHSLSDEIHHFSDYALHLASWVHDLDLHSWI